MPAAARERQAAALGQSLRQAAGVIQLPEASALRAALPAATWAAIAPPLGQLGLGAKTDAPRRPVTTLTLADLRRFLECPLQGSVRVLLPMRDDDDAEDEAEAALRDRENLGDARVQTLPLLRDLFGRAIDAGASDDAALAERYDAAIAGLRLDGTLPSGVFGGVLRAHHLALLRSWRDGLRAGAARDACRPGSRRSGTAPRPNTGATSQIAPAIPLTVPLPDGPRAIALYGQSEPLALVGGERMAVTLVVGRQRDYPERDRLRAWLTHLALAASGTGADRPLAVVGAGWRSRTASPARRCGGGFAPIAADEARALPRGPRRRAARRRPPLPAAVRGRVHLERRQRKGQAMTVREAVMLLRDDGFTRLSSEVRTGRRRPPLPGARRSRRRRVRRAPLRALLRCLQDLTT